jgi:hypothetical protein
MRTFESVCTLSTRQTHIPQRVYKKNAFASLLLIFCATGFLSEYLWFETSRPPRVPLLLKALFSDIYCYKTLSVVISDFSDSLHFGIPLFDMRCVKTVFDMKIVSSLIQAVTTVRKVNIFCT